MLLLAMVGSLVIGIVFAFMGEMMKVRDSEPSGAMPLPFAVTATMAAPSALDGTAEAVPEFPVTREPPSRPRVSPPLDARASEGLRDLTRQALTRLGARRVLVTSAGPNSGKAAIAATLARSLAIARIRTLIVDADFTDPASIARTFRLNSQKGLSELLLGRASFGEVACRDPISNAEVVPAGLNCKEAAALLDSERMDVILSALDRSYDIIILNGPPAVGQELGKSVARRVQFALLVSDAEQGSMEAAMLAAQVLIAGGAAEVVPVHVEANATRTSIEFGTASTRFGRAA